MALIVGISLWVCVVVAPILAILIPLTIKALKLDPSVASGPFITTLIDIVALAIFFLLTLGLLGGHF